MWGGSIHEPVVMQDEPHPIRGDHHDVPQRLAEPDIRRNCIALRATFPATGCARSGWTCGGGLAIVCAQRMGRTVCLCGHAGGDIGWNVQPRPPLAGEARHISSV